MSNRDYIGLAKQTAQGTKATTMQWFPQITKFESSFERETVEAGETNATYFGNGKEYGTGYYKLSLDFIVRPDVFPELVLGLFGSGSTALVEDETAAWEHTFDTAQAAPAWMSLLAVNTDISPARVDLFYDARVASLKVKGKVNDFLQGSLELIALHLDDTQEAPSATIDQSPRFNIVKTAGGTSVKVGVNGSALEEYGVSEFAFNYEVDLSTDDKRIGSPFLGSLDSGNHKCDIELTLVDKARFLAEYRRVLQDDPDDLRILFTTASTKKIATTNTPYGFSFDIKRAQLTEPNGMSIDAEKVLAELKMKAEATLEPVSGQFVVVKTVNSNANTVQ